MGDSGAQLGDNRDQLFSPNSVRLFLDIDLNIKDLKRWCQIKTPWSRIWTLILLGGRLHLLRRTESLYLGRWTLWGPVLDGRPDMVRHLLISGLKFRLKILKKNRVFCEFFLTFCKFA